ncbi:MAG: hypothetical protein LQ350_000783 [Teloschistes chrysophthalmus]|nr:MAG: hypothetical protein LQ350_000783 [Niorma chrysophthalma]
MGAAFTILSVGGPALLYYFQPTDEEVFKASHPSIQPSQRMRTVPEFDAFVNKLKGYSKSDKPIWAVAAEDEARTRAEAAEEQRKAAAEMQKRRDEIKRHSMGGQ